MYLHNYLSHKYGPLVSKPSSICTRLGRLYTKIPQFPFSSTDNSLFTVFTTNYCKQVELKDMWTTAEFCAQLPKIELHAHLNGSLSSDTLKRLHIMKEGNSADDIDIPDITKMTNLEECFKIFGLAHSLTSSPEALRVATRDVVREFAEDGVVHLELRTTPRAVESIMSHEQYVEAVLEEATREGAAQGIGVKVLLSVDRSQGEAAAQRVLALALAARRRWPEALVGLDLSGNPRSGCARALLPLLRDARARGLRVAAHCAEVENEAEAVALMEEGVADRLGHCTFAAPGAGAGAEAAWAALRATRLPVEACLSSNVRCGTVPSYASHHFGALRRHNHPVALCTDDKGVFATTLSNEYYLAAEHFSLSREELWKLSFESVEYTFASEEEKQQIRNTFLEWKKANLAQFELH